MPSLFSFLSADLKLPARGYGLKGLLIYCAFALSNAPTGQHNHSLGYSPRYTSHLFGVPTWSAAAESLGAPAPRDGDAAFPQRAELHPARRKSGVDVLHSQARFGLCHRTPSQQPPYSAHHALRYLFRSHESPLGCRDDSTIRLQRGRHEIGHHPIAASAPNRKRLALTAGDLDLQRGGLQCRT